MSSLSNSRSSSHKLRIIGGQWKRSVITVNHVEGLRPTPDRVRETLFNWLHHWFDGDWQTRHCLDLFAGSGALGIEAASRGAAAVTLVETHGAAVAQLQAMQQKLAASQLTIVRQDAFAFAQRQVLAAARFDLIFLDPPYRQNWLPRLFPVCAELLRPGGMVYVEAEVPLKQLLPVEDCGWELLRFERFGQVFSHLLRRIDAEDLKA